MKRIMELIGNKKCAYLVALLCLLSYSNIVSSQTYTLDVGGDVDISQTAYNGGYIDNVGLAAFIDPHLSFSKNYDGSARITVKSYFDYTATVKLVFIERYQSYYSGRNHTRAATYYKDVNIRCNYVAPQPNIKPTKVLLPERVRVPLNKREDIYPIYEPYGAKGTEFNWNQSQGTAVFSHGQYDNGGYHVTGRSPGLGRVSVKVDNDNNLYASTIIEVVDLNNLPPDNIFLPSSIEISIGGHTTLEPILVPEGTSTSYTWTSDNSNVCTVNYGKVTGVRAGTTTVTVKTANNLQTTCTVNVVSSNGKDDEDDNGAQITGSIDGHDFIDLGLSVKWATCNVGASKPEDFGDYFAWGETTEKSSYSWNNYKYGSNALNCRNIGNDISGTSYDAAYVNWSSNWRMPNEKEMGELISKCIITNTTQSGVEGFLVTGPNGNSIFLPTANSKFTTSYSGCRYWTSTVDDYNGRSLFINYSNGKVSPTLQSQTRPMGLPIRAITSASTSTPQAKLALSANPSGGSVESGTKVYLTAKADGSTVSGADIYYTTNGTSPSKSSNKYTSSGISITQACKLKAIAYKDGYETSEVESWNFTITSKPKLTLSASPSGGSVESGTKVYLTAKADGSTVSDADIYYTTNGAAPSKSSEKYTSSGITVISATTIKAIAYKNGYETSEVLIEDFSVEIEAENVSLPSEKKIKIGGASTWIDATLTPENATSKINWTYTNNGVISVNSYGNSVSIQGLKAGTAYVYAKIPNGKEDFCRIEVENNGDGDMFSADGIEYQIISTEERTCMLKSCNLSKVIIPESVQGYSVIAIGANAFGSYYYGHPLTSIEIPHSVLSIEKGAFSYCENLHSLKIPNTVRSIGKGITLGCDKLSSIIVEDGNPYYDSREEANAIIETSSNKLIAGCKTTKLPISIKSIGSSAFECQNGVTSMDMPLNLELIEESAFELCKNLTEMDLSGTKVKKIESRAFMNCTSLKEINLPSSLTYIGEYAFENCESLFIMDIPSQVDSISKGTFWGCKSLVSISLPQNMTCIGESAFWKCEKLANIVLPKSLQKLGKWAFNSCSSIVSLVIPTGVNTIGDYAFCDCTSLTALYSLMETPFDTEHIWGTYSAFYNISEWATLYVPKGCVDKYQNAQGWKKFKSIREISGKLTLEVDNEKNFINKGTIVKLSSNIDDTRIFYTLDGTMPGRYSKLYNSTGITLNEDCTLKAIAYKAGYIESEVLTVDYSVKENPTEQEPLKLNIKQIALFGDQSLLLETDGTLWACGDNYDGQLGDGTYTDRKTPVKVMSDVAQVSAGKYHTMMLKTDGTLWACGYNSHGQLGDGTITDRKAPVKVMSDVAQVSAGSRHTMILKSDGTLWACGDNYDGQLGDGTYTDRKTPVKVMSDVAQVSTGDNHTMIVKSDGILWACGDNGYGQLGDGTTTDREIPIRVRSDVAQVSAGGGHTMILKTDGTLWTCGYNNRGQLGNGTTADKNTSINVMADVSQVSAGGTHTMILKTDGTLWACGDNYDGQLGDGTTTDRKTPVKVMSDVAQVSAGSRHTMILKSDGTLWACGDNYDGQLGDGTTTDRTSFIKIAEPNITENETTVKTSEDGYATFYSAGFAYTLPYGLSAQVVTSVSNNKLTYKKIADGSVSGIIPAGTAVILVSSSKISSTYTLTSTASSAPYLGVNLLRGSDTATTTTGDGYHYKLSYGQPGSNLNNVFGWYWGAQNGAPFQIEGHKAWLVVPKSSLSTRGFAIGGEATGIEMVSGDDVEEADAVYYDLQGRRVTKPTVKGVYIKNGKKVMVK